jgi:hypothetical protein
MTTARRQVRLTWVPTGESVIAELLDEEAPRVCEHVRKLLPMEHDAIHGQFSGAEVFVKLAEAHRVPEENLVQLPLPGELLYFYDPGTNVQSRGTAMAEICFVYGRGVVLRGTEGVPAHASLFARVPGDWKHDWRDFAAACRRVRFDGKARLRIESVE